jgi:hypothetical protein
LKSDKYIVVRTEKEKSFKWIYWVFFGIIAFIAVYLPFIAPNLKFQVGSVLSQIFVTMGAFCVFFGGVYIIFGIVGVFLKTRGWIRKFFLGILLLWIGFYMTGTSFNLFGFILGTPQPPQGYY